MRTSVCFLLALFGSSLLARTTRAALPGDTLWSGEVSVDATVEVPPGITLRIAAGTVVRVRQGVSIVVKGTLLAEGTQAEPVRFQRRTAGTSWGRIIFLGAADSRLDHCIIEHSSSVGDHKDYYDDRDSSCEPITASRPARTYHEAVVIIASHVDIEGCIFRNLPSDGAGEGDAIAVISDDPVVAGAATAVIRGCTFQSIGQGVHTRYSYVLVEDCFFTDHRGDNDDIDLYGESTPPPYIRGNTLLDPDHDDMINPTRCSAIIDGNLVAGSDDHGIVLRDRCDPIVINNVVYNCAAAGITVQNTCNALLINNTVVDCGRALRFFDHTDRWGLPYCLAPGNGSATVLNCVLWDCPTLIELVDSTSAAGKGAHVTLSNCDVQGKSSRVKITGTASTVTWGVGILEVDPAFVDSAGRDYRLRPTSPLIDVGSTDGAPELDFDRHSRPCGAGVDLGAFETGGCGAPPGPVFVRGDINADGSEDISDPVRLVLHLFAGQAAPPCLKSADTDDNGALNLSDVLYALAYLFTDGPAPPSPGAVCGQDPTADELDCTSPPGCVNAG